MAVQTVDGCVAAGYELVAYNRTPEKVGARCAAVAKTSADLVEEVDVVITSLADDEAPLCAPET